MLQSPFSPQLSDFSEASLSPIDPISKLLAVESDPVTVLPLLEGLENTSATPHEKAVLYAYHFGDDSAEVRHLCADRFGRELVHPETALPLLCIALAREPEPELRALIRQRIYGYGLAVPQQPGHEWTGYSESARKADIRYRLMCGAKPESIHGLLISIGLDSSPGVHYEAFDVLGELFPKLSPLQREASVLTCLYLLRRSETLQPGSLNGSFYYLESSRLHSPALCEVVKHYLSHPDTYVCASAACTLMALDSSNSKLCADVLADAMLRPSRVRLDVPPARDLEEPDIVIRIARIAACVNAQLQKRHEIEQEEVARFLDEDEAPRRQNRRINGDIVRIFSEHIENCQEAAARVPEAYERSLRRLYRSFTATERSLTQGTQCSAAVRALTRLERFRSEDQNALMDAVLTLLEAGSSSHFIYRHILEHLPRASGFERRSFDRIAKMLFADRSEDFDMHACTALGRIGALNPGFRDQARLLLKAVTYGERSVYLKRHVEQIMPLLEPG